MRVAAVVTAVADDASVLQFTRNDQEFVAAVMAIAARMVEMARGGTQPIGSAVFASLGFSITQPDNTLEYIVAAIVVGGLGAVHQYVTMRAVLRDPKLDERLRRLAASAARPELEMMTTRMFVAGVIHNDFPLPGVTAENANAEFVRRYLIEIPLADAPYLTDARFRVQPNYQMRWAVGAVYKKSPQILVSVAGISPEMIRVAEDMLRERTVVERTPEHFMKRTATDTVANVIELAIRKCLGWTEEALVAESLFPIGKIVHTIEDSYSLVHCERVAPTLRQPFGAVRNIMFFGDQTDHSHSVEEGWRAVSTPGSPGADRVDWALLPIGAVLWNFVIAVEALRALAAEALANYAEERARTIRFHVDKMGRLLREQVFVMVAN